MKSLKTNVVHWGEVFLLKIRGMKCSADFPFFCNFVRKFTPLGKNDGPSIDRSP
jgi:hypothetical protein